MIIIMIITLTTPIISRGFDLAHDVKVIPENILKNLLKTPLKVHFNYSSLRITAKKHIMREIIRSTIKVIFNYHNERS